jgi:hypothetical protein
VAVPPTIFRIMVAFLNPAIFMPAKRPPVASNRRFELASQYKPAGDQPQPRSAPSCDSPVSGSELRNPPGTAALVRIDDRVVVSFEDA